MMYLHVNVILWRFEEKSEGLHDKKLEVHVTTYKRIRLKSRAPQAVE